MAKKMMLGVYDNPDTVFSVTATGDFLSYTWELNETSNIPVPQNNLGSITPYGTPVLVGTYRAIARNAVGVVTSTPANLKIIIPRPLPQNQLKMKYRIQQMGLSLWRYY